MKKCLITGFEPFGGEKINPSWLAVEQLPNVVGEYVLEKMQIPTVFGKATKTVLDHAEGADVILCVGQAGGRVGVTLELVGINYRYASIPDNEGNQPIEEKIADGENAYFTTLPVRAMAKYILDRGIPASVSTTAGTFVCNDLLYSLLHTFQGTNVKVGFIHVPYLPEQAKEGVASLPLEQTTEALRLAIESLGNV